MKKTLICLLLALCLCLCFVLASCDKDPETPVNPDGDGSGDGTQVSDPTVEGEKKGDIYYTPDQGGGVPQPEPNDPVEGGTVRY